MTHYNIILSTELLYDEDYHGVVDSLCRRCEKLQQRQNLDLLTDQTNRFITIIKPVADFDDIQPVGADDLLWTELTPTQRYSNITVCSVPIFESVSEWPDSLLLQRIHELAENLPKIGGVVDVYWLVKDEPLPSIEDNIELYGALKRLLEWNNSDFKFMNLLTDVQDNDRFEPWVTMLRGQITTLHHFDISLADTIWKGAIQIVGTNIRRPIVLPGFELVLTNSDHTEDCELKEISRQICESETDVTTMTHATTDKALPRLLADKMEVLAQLDRQEIPLLYYTGQSCQFCIRSTSKLLDKSRHFLQRLEDNRRLCYLVKLCHGTSWKCEEDESFYKDKEKKEKKTWSDYVQENIEHVLHCPTLPDLDGDLGQHVFLLCANSTDIESDSDLSCEAHLLRNPENLNGGFTHQTIVSSLWKLKPQQQDIECNRKSAELILSDLPNLTQRQLIHLKHSIKKAQLTILQAWIDKKISLGRSTQISREDLIALLKNARSNVITQLESSELLHHQRPAPYDPDHEEEIRRYKHETRDLHRLVLAYQMQAESRFGRYKSNDSLAGLSPPPRGKVVTLKAAEFLKFFQANGAPAQPLTSHVTLKKCSNRKRCMKLTPDELKQSWPGCENLQFHDIYYSHSTSGAIESKSKRLLSRFQTTETSSTCIYRQAHSPTILAVSTDQQDDITPDTSTRQTDDQDDITADRSTRSANRQRQTDDQDDITPDRSTRSANKHNIAPERDTKTANKPPHATGSKRRTNDSNRLYTAKKEEEEGPASSVRSQSNPKPSVKQQSDAMKMSKEDQSKESRSQRHKRKLEEIVKETLKKQGVTKQDALYKPCALRLYNITKSFVKDLTSSVGLRQEMERIAHNNVQMIVDFEKKNKRKK